MGRITMIVYGMDERHERLLRRAGTSFIPSYDKGSKVHRTRQVRHHTAIFPAGTTLVEDTRWKMTSHDTKRPDLLSMPGMPVLRIRYSTLEENLTPGFWYQKEIIDYPFFFDLDDAPGQE